MSRVPTYIDSPEKERPPTRPDIVNEFRRFRDALNRTYVQVARILNGNLSFGNGVDRDNLDGVWVSVLTPTPGDTDFTVVHNLGRVPVGYLLMRSDLPSLIYDGSVIATTTELTLRNATDGANIVLFII